MIWLFAHVLCDFWWEWERSVWDQRDTRS